MSRLFAELPLLRRLKPGLIVHDGAELNAEPAIALLDEPITPVSAFFIRNNGDLPKIGDAANWRLTVDGEVERPLVWSLETLRDRFESVTVTAVLECAGNGRACFAPATDGLPWRRGAVGCARWTGVRLADVLAVCGVKPGAVYTGQHAPDRALNDTGRPALSRGLPIAKALAPETLIAFAMNDEPLPVLHGGPLRIVAPGFPGSAWQKWLTRIELRASEHDGEKMRGTDYRLPRVPVRPGEAVDPGLFDVIVDMPVKSLITRPAAGFSIAAGEALTVAGWAWSGAIPVARVGVSCDGGLTWLDADLEAGEGPFAWRRFTARCEIARPGPVSVLARAVDGAGGSQPLGQAPWNPRGYCNNAAHRVEGVAF